METEMMDNVGETAVPEKSGRAEADPEAVPFDAATYVLLHPQSNRVATSGVRPDLIDLFPFGNLPGQLWRLIPLPDGYFRIESPADGKVLDVAGASQADDAPVVAWTWSAGLNQQWRMIDLGERKLRFVARHSRKVLSVVGDGENTPWGLVQQVWRDEISQHWQIGHYGNQPVVAETPHKNGVAVKTEDVQSKKVDSAGPEVRPWLPDGNIREEGWNRKTEYALFNVENGLVITSDGEQRPALMTPWQGQPSQRWRVVSVVGSCYRIETISSGRILEVRGASAVDNVNIVESRWNGAVSQQWMFIPSGKGRFRIQSRHSEKVIEPQGAFIGDEVHLVQRLWAKLPRQLWVAADCALLEPEDKPEEAPAHGLREDNREEAPAHEVHEENREKGAEASENSGVVEQDDSVATTDHGEAHGVQLIDESDCEPTPES